MAIVRSNEELNKYAESKVAKVTSTDDAIVRFDGTTGEVQDSSVTISDTGAMELKGSGREIRLYTPDGRGYGKVGNASNAAGGIALKGYSTSGYSSYVDLSAISTANAGIYRIGRDSNIAEGQIAEFQIYKHDGSSASAFKIDCKTGDIMNMGALNISKVAATNGSLASNGNVFSGTYAPTATGIANISAITTYGAQYMRVGNVVTVSGKVNFTATTANVYTVFTLSVPVANNNFTDIDEAGGVMACSSSVASVMRDTSAGAILARIGYKEVIIQISPSTTSSRAFHYSYTYQII